MVNKCVARGCKTGYASEASTGKSNAIGKFKFPIDLERRKKWINAVPCEAWQPTKSLYYARNIF